MNKLKKIVISLEMELLKHESSENKYLEIK